MPRSTTISGARRVVVADDSRLMRRMLAAVLPLEQLAGAIAREL